MNRRKEPLYRKENKASLSTKYYVNKGGDFRHSRNTKAFRNDERMHQPMHSGQFQYDYTPLFMFLLSRVGKSWDEAYSEAKSRLDKEEPIFYMVALHEANRKDIVRCGQSSYYSGLFVDDDGLLQKVNTNAVPTDYIHDKETLSFNGKPMIS